MIELTHVEAADLGKDCFSGSLRQNLDRSGLKGGWEQK